MKKTYNDFLQLIADGQFKGYQVCFERSNLEKERWTAERFLDYIGELERYKNETGITITYDFLSDTNNRVHCIDVLIHYPADNDIPERNHSMHWIVQYK